MPGRRSHSRQMTPIEQIISQAEDRRSQHRGPTRGFCHLCFRLELEDHLARENPTMKRDDIIQLADEWILAADGRVN